MESENPNAATDSQSLLAKLEERLKRIEERGESISRKEYDSLVSDLSGIKKQMENMESHSLKSLEERLKTAIEEIRTIGGTFLERNRNNPPQPPEPKKENTPITLLDME